MCDGLGRPASVTQALAMLDRALDHLNAADAASLPASVQAEALRALERAGAKHTAARARVLAAFAGQAAYEDDGHGSARTWLKWQTRVTNGAAARPGWPPGCAPPSSPALRPASPWPPPCLWTSAEPSRPSGPVAPRGARPPPALHLPRLPGARRMLPHPPLHPPGPRRAGHRGQPRPGMPVPPPHRRPPVGLDPDPARRRRGHRHQPRRRPGPPRPRPAQPGRLSRL
jgi:hypothetical protein